MPTSGERPGARGDWSESPSLGSLCFETCLPIASGPSPLARFILYPSASNPSPLARSSFPFYRARRLRADVVHHAVDAAHLVDDAVGDLAQDVVGQLRPVRRHPVYA